MDLFTWVVETEKMAARTDCMAARDISLQVVLARVA